MLFHPLYSFELLYQHCTSVSRGCLLLSRTLNIKSILETWHILDIQKHADMNTKAYDGDTFKVREARFAFMSSSVDTLVY